MPITHNIDTSHIRDFSNYADRLLARAVGDGQRYGSRRMVELVPKARGRLSGAVYGHGPTVIAPHEFRGEVGVNMALAPHAVEVDRGTGIQGPKGKAVTINRRSIKSPSKPGRMKFFKNGEGAGDGIYRAAVKIHPSSKIERGKNYLRRTYDSMVVWTSVRVTEITADVAAYFARHR